MCGQGGGLWEGRLPTVTPHVPPPALPLRPVSVSRQPFCEHVLQHSCCSTFLWQRLFFLTSMQKLPSAQDSSFAFHRPGRGNTGGWGGHAHTNTQGRTIRNGWMAAESYDWSGEFSEDRKGVFWSNHRWCSSRWKWLWSSGVILVPCQERGKRDMREKKKKREKNITQLAILRYLKITSWYVFTLEKA